MWSLALDNRRNSSTNNSDVIVITANITEIVNIVDFSSILHLHLCTTTVA
jgi:hypothetical protein